MNILYSSKFIRNYKKLPNKIKNLTEEKENIFRQNPFDKKLKTHKLSGKFRKKIEKYWSFSVDHKYRIVFRFTNKNTVHFYLIGTHRVYR